MRPRSMHHRFLLRFFGFFFVAALSLRVATWGIAQNAPAPAVKALGAPSAAEANARPHYKIDARIDYELLTFKSAGLITIPVTRGDALRDVVFFIFANAGGVGGDDERRKNIVVDNVSLDGAKIPFTLNGAVLRARSRKGRRFALQIDWHGVVPAQPGKQRRLSRHDGRHGHRYQRNAGRLDGRRAGRGRSESTAAGQTQDTDYGLYTYGNGILSAWVRSGIRRWRCGRTASGLTTRPKA